MSERDVKVVCDHHGECYATFVCEHLAGHYGQGYFCSTDDDGDPCPDAWCYRCDCNLMARGDWDDESEAFANIQVMCSECYAAARDRNAVRSGSVELNGWELGTRDDVLHVSPAHQFPSEADLATIRVGATVKLLFLIVDDLGGGDVLQGERMWVEVTDVCSSYFRGILVSQPFTHGRMASGEYVEFKPEHIVAVG